MRKKFLKTKLLVMVMASVSILFTGCGKKDTEDLLPVETLSEQGTDSLDAEGIEETYMSPEELDEIEAMKTNPFEDETDEITEAEMASVEAELARQKEEDAKAAEKTAEKDTKAVSKAEEKKDAKTTAKTDTKKDATTSTKNETTAPAKQETTSSSTGSSANNSTSGTTTSTPASTPAASMPTTESSQPATPAPAPAPETPNKETCSHEFAYIGPGITQPNCIAMGTSYYKCTKCGYAKDETDVPALGHDYSIVQEIVVGDCLGPSTVRYTCSRCGSSYDQQENLHADEHTWTTVTIQVPNEETFEYEDVTKTYCTNCGKMQ